MKTKISIMLFSVAAFILVALGVFGVADVSAMHSGLGDFVLAAAPAAVVVEGASATTATAKSASGDLLTESISDVITQISPAATPLDTILRTIGKDVSVDAWETKYYAVDLRGIADTVTVALDGANTATAEITVGNIHIWSVDDNLLVQGVNGNDAAELVCHVVGKNTSTNKLTVFALNGFADVALNANTGVGSYVPDIAQNKVITRMGNAKSELDVQTAPYSIYPTPISNWSQIHMAQVEESLYEKMHAKEVKWDINDFYTQAIFDLRRQMELTSIWGYAPATQPVFDPVGNDKKYFSKGIVRNITKVDTYTTGSLDSKNLNAFAKKAFTGNSGSDERILFVGKDLMEEMSNLSVSKQIDAKNVEVKWGIRFNTIETNFGRFLIKHHNLFNDMGWEKKGLVLDMNNIQRHVFKKFEDLTLDLRTSGQKNVNANVISEAFCLAVRYPDTHMIIKPA